MACEIDTDCGSDGICVNNLCQSSGCDSNDPSTCPAGYECSALTLECVPSQGTDGGSPTDGGNNTGGCTGRCDCPGDGQICLNGKCQAAPADGKCVNDKQCPLGTICEFSGKCVPGCADQCDCKGTKTCNTNTLQCEACSPTNPCPTGQSCSSTGECTAAPQCTSNAQCSGGQVCKSGFCGFCTATADCASFGSGYVCGSNGLCAQNQCTDASCQAALGTPRAYCNTTTQACDTYECVANTDCVAPATCNTTTHTCSGGTSTCDSTCNGQDCVSQGLACEPTTCTCTSQPTGNLCGPQNAGLAVKRDCTACDLSSCISGGCVDASDPTIQCAGDFFTCLIGGLIGISFCN